MAIQIQLVTERWDPVSAAIRYTTRSPFSHAEFVVDSGWTLGSRAAGGVRFRHPSLSRRYTLIRRFTAPGIELAFDWAFTQVGKPYDFSAIFGIALDRNWRDEGHWFCSELIMRAFEMAGTETKSWTGAALVAAAMRRYALLSIEANPWRITPRDLALSPFLERLPETPAGDSRTL